MKTNFPCSIDTLQMVSVLLITFWISSIAVRCEQDPLTNLKHLYFTQETEDSIIIHVGNQQKQDDRLKRSSVTTAECYTNKGEVGACKPFQECFPLLVHNSSNNNVTGDEDKESDYDVELSSAWPALYEEIFNNMKSSGCSEQPTRINASSESGNFPICCAVQNNTVSDDLPLEFKQDVPEAGGEMAEEEIFPPSCGQVFNAKHRLSRDQDENKTQKITGGQDTRPGQFPWMVAIFGKNGKQTCGASLITNQHILTASHCLFSYTANDIPHLRVHLGDYNIQSQLDGPHETRKISKIILHKGFNSKTYFNDVALMKLDSPVNFTDKIQPICLPEKDMKTPEGSNAVVMGWGRSRQWGSASAVLKAVEIPIWKYEACHRVFSTFAPGRLMESNICAGDGKRNKDACIGDSGGPLVIRDGSRWTQIGIVSWGKGCGSFPGVYTSTKSFLSFIGKNIRK